MATIRIELYDVDGTDLSYYLPKHEPRSERPAARPERAASERPKGMPRKRTRASEAKRKGPAQPLEGSVAPKHPDTRS